MEQTTQTNEEKEKPFEVKLFEYEPMEKLPFEEEAFHRMALKAMSISLKGLAIPIRHDIIAKVDGMGGLFFTYPEDVEMESELFNLLLDCYKKACWVLMARTDYDNSLIDIHNWFYLTKK